MQISLSTGHYGPQRNAIYTAFRWRIHDDPTLNAGLVALWIFRVSGQV